MTPRSLPAAAIGCADIRPWLAAYLSGQIALTERVLVDAHLRQCGSCRAEPSPRPTADDQPPAARSRMPVDSLLERNWSLVTGAATEAASRVIVGLMRAISLGTDHGARLLARVPSVPTTARGVAARVLTRPPGGPPPLAGSPAAASRPGPKAPPLEARPPVTRTVPTAVAPQGFARARAAEVSGAGSLAPTPVPAPRVAAPHVVGRLSTKNRSAAERAVTALLAAVRGTEVARTSHARFTAVEAIVPSAGYREFTDGLCRIGSWRLEATTFSLPEAVHVTVRVSE